MALLDSIDHLVLDCDGVVYVGDRPVPGTARLATEARRRGITMAFMTNDTTRSRAELAATISAAGVEASPDEIVSAGRATALWCAESNLSPVAHLGSPQFSAELSAAGLDVRTCMGSEPGAVVGVTAVVVGSADTLTVRDLEVALAAWTEGMPILAGNGDRTYPGTAGPRLGCGSLAQALAHATGQTPIVVGKPEPMMFREAEILLRSDGSASGRIALLGDSVASDVVGANRAGWTSVLLHDGEAAPTHSARPPEICEPDLVVASPLDLLAD